MTVSVVPVLRTLLALLTSAAPTRMPNLRALPLCLPMLLR